MKVKVVSALASDINELERILEKKINDVICDKVVKDVKINVIQDPFYRGYCAIATILLE